MARILKRLSGGGRQGSFGLPDFHENPDYDPRARQKEKQEKDQGDQLRIDRFSPYRCKGGDLRILQELAAHRIEYQHSELAQGREEIGRAHV